MNNSENNVDVRNLGSDKQYSAIINAFHKLGAGESAIIIIDENPRPIKFQIATEHADDKFIWESLEDGPDVWKLRIAKISY